MKETSEIDFVIIWVDDTDRYWQIEKEKYAISEDVKFNSGNVRYRDWGILKYWFRGVEKYAPWVRKIHFVTCGHIPSWLNLDNPKLHFVRHSDYMSADFLPTFSSHPIELNLHRIEGLSDEFVYFNDDMFVNAPVKPTDFFRNGLPCDSAVRNIPNVSRFGLIDMNALIIIGKHFDFISSFRRNPWRYLNWRYGWQNLRFLLLSPWPLFCGFKITHTAHSYLKSTFEEVWEKESEALHETCLRKFRDVRNVNQYVFRYWQLAKGNFSPRKYSFSGYYSLSDDSIDEIAYDIYKGKYKIICLNDNESLAEIHPIKEKLIKAFDYKFPEKSSFEL